MGRVRRPNNEQSARDLLARMKAGDEAAFEALFERQAQRIKAVAKKHMPPRLLRKVSLNDVLQETRILAQQRLGDFRGERSESFGAWLLKIAELKAKEEVRKYLRTDKRNIGREVSRGQRPETRNLLGDTPTPSQWAIRSEDRAAARRAMQRLSEDRREVLRLARVEGLPLSEVAARLGRTYEAVRQLHVRAWREYCALLREETGG